MARCFSCSSIVEENMKILSRYTWINRAMYSLNTAVINLWKVDGILQSPCCITRLTNIPKMVAKAVLGTFSGLTCICSYALDISNLDLYGAHAMLWWMVSWSGKGDMSFSVLSFCWRRSKTVHSLPFFLRTQSISMAWRTIVGTHQPVLVYWLIFSASL